MQGRSLTSCDL